MRFAFFHKGYEDLGIEALSATLKAAGHEVDLYWDGSAFSSNIGLDNALLSRLFDVSRRRFGERVEERLRRRPPDAVGFGGPTANFRWSLSWARRIKERLGVPVVYGGPHATCAPEATIAETCIDAVIRGEADSAVAPLLESVSGGHFTRADIPGLWLRRGADVIRNPVGGYIHDLDSLPFFDKDLFNDKADVCYRQYMTMTGRGCPFACTYCCQPAYKALYADERRHVRRRSPGHVVEELERAKRDHDVRFVSFRDDVFTVDDGWLEEFAPLYRERVGIPFFCYGHPGTITERTADALDLAGCRQLKLGVQTWNEKLRREILNRRHHNERVFEVGRLLRARGIELLVDQMMLLPGETEGDAAEAVERYLELQPNSITNFHLVLFPGTPMVDIALERGLIEEADRAAIDRGERLAEFSNPDAATRREHLRRLKYQYYMDLVPLLPAPALRAVFERRLLHLLPYSFALRQALTLLADLSKGNIRLRYMLWYALARKDFP